MPTIRKIAEKLPKGLDTEVLGELPLTADGFIIGYGAFGFYYIRGNKQEVVGPFHSENTERGWSGPQQWHVPSDCYTTREAAAASARKDSHHAE